MYKPTASDPEISDIITKLEKNLESLPEMLINFRELFEHGMFPGQLRGITEAEYSALYRIACRLCDEDEFQRALFIALQLVVNDPVSSKYAFLAASCLQRTGQVAEAALMYAQTLALDENHAGAAYRLGESLVALGKSEEAKRLFETSIELSRGDFARQDLMRLAEHALSEI